MQSNLTKQDSLALKGIAIILMVAFHCFYAPSFFEGYALDFSPFTQEQVVSAIKWGKSCVSIFAFISGYGLYLSYTLTKDNNNVWIAKRYVKSFSGFWFVYVLTFAVTFIAVGLPPSKYLTDGYIRAIVFGFIDFMGLAQLFSTPTLCGAWWYMTAAALFICSLPLLVKLEKRIGWLATLALIVMVPRFLIMEYLHGMNAMAFVPVFFCGLLCAKYEAFAKHDQLCARINKILLFFVDTAVFAASILAYTRLQWTVLWEYHYLVAPIVCIVYARRYILRLPIVDKVLQFFGKHSMDIFLTHMVIQLTLFKEWTYSFRPFWLIPIILFAVSLAVAIVIELIKKLVRYDDLIGWLIGKIGTGQQGSANGA